MIIVRRVKPLPYWIVPVLALIIGILVAIIILYGISGGQISPVDILVSIGQGFLQPSLLAMTFILLSIVGTGLLVSFKGAIWNIGGEGQIYMGAMITVWVVLFSPIARMPGPIGGFTMKITYLILAVILGGFWAFLAALPRAYLNLDEVPITLMMNYIAYFLVDILIWQYWHETKYGYFRTETIPENAWFKTLFFRVNGQVIATTLSLELLFILIIVFFAAWFLLKYTTIGLYIKVLGNNPNLLKSSGISVKLIIILALTISGAIIGIVGAGYVAGITHHLSYPVEEKSAQYGYTGILVAWLSMLELIAIPVAAYIIAALYNAGINMQILGAGGAAVVNVFIGSILITYTALIMISEYKVKFIIKRRG